MHKIITSSLALSLCIISPVQADEQEKNRATARKELSVAVVNLGLGLTRAIISASDTSFPPSDKPVSAQRKALEQALGDYKKARAEAHGHVQAMRSTADFAINGAAVVMTATGVGVIPATLMKGGAQIVTDMGLSAFESQINASVNSLLVKKKDTLLNIAGVSYDMLRGMSPDEIKETLENAPEVFDDMNKLMSDDPKVLELSKEILVKGIINTQKATLDQLKATQDQQAEAAGQLRTLTAGFVTFRDATIAKIDEHSEAIQDLQGSVGKLQVSMANVEGRLKVQERDGAIVADFVFSQMSPVQKIEALNSGFLGERFTCSNDAIDCEQSKLKKDLIERFQNEADVQRRTELLGRTAQGLSDISQLATNLNINIPGLSEAAGIGNVAFNAFTQFSQGNILGAITTVSGLFAKRTDPDQERFEATMQFMKQEFDQIKNTLTKIQENQQKLMEAVVALSEQVARQYQALDERLARMEFEVNRVSEGVRKLVWNDLKACAAVYDYVRENPHIVRLNAFGDFESFSDIRKAADVMRESAISCKAITLSEGSGIGHANWFGNILDAKTSIAEIAHAAPEENSGDAVHKPSDLERFIATVHQPTWVLFGEMLSRHKVPWSIALDRLAAPPPRMESKTRRLQAFTDGAKVCGEDGALLERLKPLVCSGSGGEHWEAKALDLLSTPMVVDFAIDFADWILIVSRMIDILDPVDGKQLTEKQLLELAKNPDRNLTAGRRLVEMALRMVDASVVSYSLLYGDMTAWGVLETLHPKNPNNNSDLSRHKLAQKLLKANSYLAANTAMILLREKYAENMGKNPTDAPSYTAYLAAINLAAASASDPWLMLRTLFGSDLTFDIAPEGGRYRVKVAEDVMVPLPGPDEFVQGKFSFPPRFIALLTQRERLYERLLDYHFYEGVDEDMRASLAKVLSQP